MYANTWINKTCTMYYIWYHTRLTTLFLVLKNQNTAFLESAKMTHFGYIEHASFVAVL